MHSSPQSPNIDSSAPSRMRNGFVATDARKRSRRSLDPLRCSERALAPARVVISPPASLCWHAAVRHFQIGRPEPSECQKVSLSPSPALVRLQPFVEPTFLQRRTKSHSRMISGIGTPTSQRIKLRPISRLLQRVMPPPFGGGTIQIWIIKYARPDFAVRGCGRDLPSRLHTAVG